jgi:hypothetical protein
MLLFLANVGYLPVFLSSNITELSTLAIGSKIEVL